MNGIVFSEGKKKIIFDVIGYQFSYSKDDEYDANWLTIQIDYSFGNHSQKYQDSCILTWELKEFSDAIDSIARGEETGYISEFMEPYLKIAVTRVDEIYAVQIRFVYDALSDPWKEIYISQGFDDDRFNEFNEALKQLNVKFPIR